MPVTPEPHAADTPVLSPVQIAELVAAARAVKAAKTENEKTDEHRPLGVVLGKPPVE
jgi:hypothetical protein